MIQRAIKKDPPFEAKEKESDKGFKDALIWESLKEYKKKNVKDTIVLYSKDKRIVDIFLQKEYKEIFAGETYDRYKKQIYCDVIIPQRYDKIEEILGEYLDLP